MTAARMHNSDQHSYVNKVQSGDQGLTRVQDICQC